jgi:GAF domain-containing protein
MTAHTSAEVSMGMRVARDGSAGADAPLSLGEVSELLARARSREDLDAAAVLIARLMHADEVVVSLVLDGERCVQTLSATGRSPVGERYGYDDYPTTEHVVRAQRLGQLIEGDPAADPAELRLLAEQGFAALLMAPIIFRGVTVGLLEVSRCTPRPWTGREIDQARLVAHSLGAVVQSELGELPWTPSGFERAARRTS